MGLVIAIAGLHGTGKSSQARKIAETFNLEYISIGMIFRELAERHDMDLERFSKHAETHPEIDNELDALITEKARKGNCVIDSQLAAWKSEKYADLKIFLTAPLEVRIKRIAERDSNPTEQARTETIARESSEKMRYLNLYNINIEETSIYDLIINTESWSLDGVFNIIKIAIEQKMKNK